MSQEVLSLQEKHPNQWNSAKEIAKALGVPATYIFTALKALRKLPAPKGAGVLRVVPLILSKVCQRGLTG